MASEERKKSGAEKAIDRAEVKARAKVLAAIKAWAPVRSAQNALADIANEDDVAVLCSEQLTEAMEDDARGAGSEDAS